MTKPSVPNRMKYEQVEKLYRALSPDERLIVNDRLGLTFKSDLDKVYDAFERLSDEDRTRFFDMQDEDYCGDCGALLGEEHDCPNAPDGDEDDDDLDDDDGDDDGEEDRDDDIDDGPESEPPDSSDGPDDDDSLDDVDDEDDEDGFDDTEG